MTHSPTVLGKIIYADGSEESAWKALELAADEELLLARERPYCRGESTTGEEIDAELRKRWRANIVSSMQCRANAELTRSGWPMQDAWDSWCMEQIKRMDTMSDENSVDPTRLESALKRLDEAYDRVERALERIEKIEKEMKR